MKLLEKNSRYILFLGALFVFIFMYYISSSVPLAGDDWGYALNETNQSAFMRALEFYTTWSGRFFAEFYGFLVAPHKAVWNILNACLFTGIFVGIMKLVQKKYAILSTVVLLVLMFSVNQVLRIETYSWIMGTTYVIPLFLMIVYFYLIKPIVLENKELTGLTLLWCVILNFYICLSMENAAAILLAGNMLMLGYILFNTKKLKHRFWIILIVSVIGVCIIRMSPGAQYRTMNEHAAFIEMGLFKQIATNWSSFLSMTFINNQYMMLGLSSLLGFITIHKAITLKSKEYFGYACIQGLAMFMCVVKMLYSKINFSILLVFFDVEYTSSALIVCSICYILYTVGTTITLIRLANTKEEAVEGVFYLMMAGGANMVMLVSPIFGARSSLYTVYMIFILIIYCMRYLQINFKVEIVVSVVVILFLGTRVKDLYSKYQQVRLKDMERMSIIAYYQDNQEDLNVWIPRMPEGLIHSADIEFGDDYHFEVFKKYYGINEEATVTFSQDAGY